jgi:MFS family permease
MTDMDLICADPAKIGLMGSVAFISVGFGSILLGGLMDQYGRKIVLMGTLAVNPLVITMWLVYPSLLTIYFGLFWIGLCYSVRASCAYVYTTENLL